MTEQTPQQRSAELRRKIEAALAVASDATDGPWEVQWQDSEQYRAFICITGTAPHIGYVCENECTNNQPTLDFIAAARTAYPAALRAAIAVLDAVDGFLAAPEPMFPAGMTTAQKFRTSEGQAIARARARWGALHDAALSLLDAIEAELVLPDAPQEVK